MTESLCWAQNQWRHHRAHVAHVLYSCCNHSYSLYSIWSYCQVWDKLVLQRLISFVALYCYIPVLSVCRFSFSNSLFSVSSWHTLASSSENRLLSDIYTTWNSLSWVEKASHFLAFLCSYDLPCSLTDTLGLFIAWVIVRFISKFL